jgi:transposase
VCKGHDYRIVVSDLEKHHPIWFGGTDRSEASMDEFYEFRGKTRAGKLRLTVMDMWKAFRNSTNRHAPQAAVLFDKFHILRHLSEALDKVRKQEYARLSGRSRMFIKGQKYALLSHPENLTGDARKEPQVTAGGQQTPEHRLPSQRVLRPTVGLDPRALGS